MTMYMISDSSVFLQYECIFILLAYMYTLPCSICMLSLFLLLSDNSCDQLMLFVLLYPTQNKSYVMLCYVVMFPLTKGQQRVICFHVMTPLCGYTDNVGPQVARFVGPTWGPTGADKTHVGPMLAPWALLSGTPCHLTWRIIKINNEPTFVYFLLERELQRIHEDNLMDINHKNTYVYIFNSVTEIFIGKLGTYIYFDIFSIALYCTVFIHRCRPIRGSIEYIVLASDECLLSIWHLP